MILLLIHLVIIYFDTFGPSDSMQEVNVATLFLESLALFSGFIVMGTLLVVELRKYYEKRYSEQRKCLIKQIISVSIVMVF